MCFSSLEKFLNFMGDIQLNSIIVSLSCGVIKAQLDTSDEIGPLAEFVNQLEIQKKYLVIEVPKIHNSTVLKNKIMNYNAMIYHDGRNMLLFLSSKNFSTKSFIGGQITSLCPALGKKYALIYQGTCPVHLQEPANKELQIFYIGMDPFIQYPKHYGKLGGSEFMVMKLLAKKHKFTPILRPAKSFDIVKTNGTQYGLVYQVKMKPDLNKTS